MSIIKALKESGKTIEVLDAPFITLLFQLIEGEGDLF